MRFDLDDEVPSYGLTSRRILIALLDARRGGRRAASASRPLQQSRTCRRRRHARRHDGGSRGPADPFRPCAVLRLCGSARRRFRVGGGDASAQALGGPSQRDARCRAGRVRPDLHDIPRHPAPVLGRNAGRPESGYWSTAMRRAAASCPIAYRRTNGVNALQFAIGLELFLRSPDPWRVLLRPTIPTAAPSPPIPASSTCSWTRRSATAVVVALPQSRASELRSPRSSASEPRRDRDHDACRSGAAPRPRRSRPSRHRGARPTSRSIDDRRTAPRCSPRPRRF